MYPLQTILFCVQNCHRRKFLLFYLSLITQFDVVKQTNYYPQEVIEIWNIPEGGSMGMWKVFLRQYFDSLMLR